MYMKVRKCHHRKDHQKRDGKRRGAAEHIAGKRIHLLATNPRVDCVPKIAAASAASRRKSQNLIYSVLARESGQRRAQFVAGELVSFGRHYQKIASGMPQEIDELAIRRLRWDIDINQGNTQF
jgi:hypothetical protein